MEETIVLLFVSNNSIYYQSSLDEFKLILSKLEEIQPFKSEVIDVLKNPEKADEYKIDAIPTLIIGNKRFIGKPSAEKIIPHITKTDT